MNPTIKIIIREDYKVKNDLQSVFLRLTIDRKQKYYNLYTPVPGKYWTGDKSKGWVLKNCPDSYDINFLIDDKFNRANNIILDFKKDNRPLTFFDFEIQFFSTINNKNSFYEFCIDVIKENTGKYSKETQRTYTSQITKLKQFKKELQFNDVTDTFIHKYELFMIKDLHNGQNTYFKSLGFIKTMINKAVQLGYIKGNPFKNIHLKRKEGNRQFLNIEEIKRLTDLYDNYTFKRYQKNVLQYFLFACYTGLRYRDIYNLNPSNIQNDHLLLQMHKTKDFIKIPLTSKAKALIGNAGTGFEQQKIFRVLSNQKTNEYLKEIIKLAEINKKISFHCARHTFATIGLEIGIPIEVIKELLGHRDIHTTFIYAKILEGSKRKHMDKWESI